MLRYVALLWDHTQSDAGTTASALRQRLTETSPGLVRSLSNPGLYLFVATGPLSYYRTHLLENGCGAVLGVLFARGDPRRGTAGPAQFLDSQATREIVRSRGRHLVDAYWGRYVAFLDDPSAPVRRVLRDPMGDIQCYHAQAGGVHIYFSSLADLLQLEVVRLTVNWEHLGLRVITGNAWADESALNEVDCVRPGECIEHRGDRRSRNYYWHPYELARQSGAEEMGVAARELRSTVRGCTQAWASLHEQSIHILSGGLDSSIVLSCLGDTPGTRIICLNFRTLDRDSDERPYARMAATRAGCELVEIERAASVALEEIFNCVPTAGPQHLVMRGLEVQPLIAKVARERQATAVFSGDGGDLVFFRGWPQLAVIDYAHRRGINIGLLRLARGASLPAQLSVWQLLGDAVRHGVFRKPWDIRAVIFDHYRLVTEEVVLNARRKLDFLNPWNLPNGDLPPGKLLHAFGATRPALFRDPLATGAALDFINPLLCQPVVELCLRIPTYLHAADGKDRAVARTAFADDLPPAVVARVWKGGADRHLQELLSDNIGLVRELLLEGGLVKAGILDRQRLEKAVAPGFISSRSHATEVFGYFCVEAWLRRWNSGTAR